MTFLELQKRFPNDLAVINYFIQIRYQGDVKCHHCQSKQVYHRKDNPKLFQCAACHNHFSIFKGTIFEDSSTDLVKWMYASRMFLNGKKGISGLQLKREIGVTYKTAWRMLRQIRIAMASEEMKGFFENVVEIDETYVGGKPRKENKKADRDSKKNGRGRGAGKTPIIGVVDRENKKVHAKVSLPNKAGKNLSGDQLLSVLKEVAKAGATVMTDGYISYSILTDHGYTRLIVDHKKQFVCGEKHTNGIESFWATLKRGIYGIYHSVSIQHLQLYVNEFCFRHNNRDNKDAFDTLMKQCIIR